MHAPMLALSALGGAQRHDGPAHVGALALIAGRAGAIPSVALDLWRILRYRLENAFQDEEPGVAQKSIGIIMNGVSGRMGYRQHLVRSILAIREQGGVLLADGERVQV